MSREQDAYDSATSALVAATKWAELVGSPYHGGAGGVGEVRTIEVKATVYHQAYDGATNYHEAPEALRLALAAAIKAHWPTLIGHALERMATNKRAAAAAFHAKLAEIAAEVQP